MDLKEKADRFLTIFRGECLHRRQELDFAQMMSYFEVLKELEPVDVEAAALRLRKISDFFPSSAEWHRQAMAYAIDRAGEFTLTKEPTEYAPHCAVCRDSGFAPGTREGFVRFCACRETNPVLERERLTMIRLRGNV